MTEKTSEIMEALSEFVRMANNIDRFDPDIPTKENKEVADAIEQAEKLTDKIVSEEIQ